MIQKIIGKISPWMLLSLFSLSSITETSCTAALPNISKYFNVEESLAQVTSSIYFFGFSIGILTLGRISDIFGRKPVILCGITLYTICTSLIIFSRSIEELAFLRFGQAIGASVGSVVAQAMARDSYKGWELSYVFASLAMALALVPSLGFAIGGYIVEYYNFRYIFVILAITSSIMLLLYVWYLPETNPYIGVTKNNKYFAIFKVVMCDKVVLLYAVIIGFMNGMLYGFYVEAPFIFMERIKLPPSEYGKIGLLFCVAGAIGSFINRSLLKKHIDSLRIMRVGLVCSLIGCGGLVFSSMLLDPSLGKRLSISLIILPMMVHMIGQSLIVPLALRHALENYSKVTGTAGSLFGALYYFIIALVNFMVSRFHGYDIIKFSVLFFTLSLICNICFYMIQKISIPWRTNEYS